jgi:acyl-CoA dehydrogenase
VVQPTAGQRPSVGSMHTSIEHNSCLNLSVSVHALDLLERLKNFLQTAVFSVERELAAAMDALEGNEPFPPLMADLRAHARSVGLWNLFLPSEAGLTNVEYAHVCELLGRTEWAPTVVNCNFPDTGNAEMLLDHGSFVQQRRWLRPLLDGDIRSCFAMTEPEVASSDPTDLRTTARRHGDGWVVNGRKWFVSGAIGASVCLTMVRTDDSPDRHRRLSVVLVPMSADGVKVIRRIPVFGHSAGPGHCEIQFDNCRVGADALLGDVGMGFRIAQDRLGPGRIHHCMRAIGLAERALELTCQRAVSRRHGDGALADEPVIRDFIARSRIDIDAARMLVLRAANTIDQVGKRAAYRDISVAKVFVPSAVQAVVDRAIQVHGALGVSDDTPLARMWAVARALRIGDGADEVHIRTIAKRELSGYPVAGVAS